MSAEFVLELPASDHDDCSASDAGSSTSSLNLSEFDF